MEHGSLWHPFLNGLEVFLVAVVAALAYIQLATSGRTISKVLFLVSLIAAAVAIFLSVT